MPGLRQETKGPDEIERAVVETAEETTTVVPGKVITQQEILDLGAAREDVVQGKLLVKEAEATVKKLEAGIMSGLKKELPVEGGPYLAEIDVKLGQCRPKWREEFEQVTGPEEVQEVIANTPRSETKVVKLGPNPHWKA